MRSDPLTARGAPARIATLPELASALNELRGTRSYADLSRAAKGLPVRDGRQPALPSSTLSDLLSGRSMPSKDTVTTFVAACGLTCEQARRPWLAAWERVSTAHLARPRGAIRIRDARPRLLGVHPAIQVPEAESELPVYVPRDLDAELRTAITAAAERGGFVLLIGDSSVGKTRTLFEAVKTTLPEWWLLHPDDPDAVDEFSVVPCPRTVVWLDELQRYLNHPHALRAGTIRSLITEGVVLAATLWPDEYGKRVTPPTLGLPDLYANERDLLKLAHVLSVPNALSTDERRRAEKLHGDPRIRIALDARDAGFTQVLAAGPELVRWWEQAPADRCYGKAIITAALDARRVGARSALTREYLAAAAPGYLTAVQQATAPADWLDHALEYATTPLHGATSTLSPVPASMGQAAGYEVADYLHQHALRVRRTTRLPDTAWQALVDNHHPDDTLRLAENAERRARAGEAEALYRQAVDGSDDLAAMWLADFLLEHDRIDEAVPVLRQLGDAGDIFASAKLAHLRAEENHIGGPAHCAGARDSLGTNEDGQLSGDDRMEEPTQRGDDTDWPRRWMPDVTRLSPGWFANRTRKDRLLVMIIVELAKHDEIVNSKTVIDQANALAEDGRVEGAISLLRQGADNGVPGAAEKLAELLFKSGCIDELTRRAEAGDSDAALRWASLLVEDGRLEQATSVLREHTHANPFVGAYLARLLVKAGRLDEALSILRERSDAADPLAPFYLIELLTKHGRIDELEAEVAAGVPGAANALRGVAKD